MREYAYTIAHEMDKSIRLIIRSRRDYKTNTDKTSHFLWSKTITLHSLVTDDNNNTKSSKTSLRWWRLEKNEKKQQQHHPERVSSHISLRLSSTQCSAPNYVIKHKRQKHTCSFLYRVSDHHDNETTTKVESPKLVNYVNLNYQCHYLFDIDFIINVFFN